MDDPKHCAWTTSYEPTTILSLYQPKVNEFQNFHPFTPLIASDSSREEMGGGGGWGCGVVGNEDHIQSYYANLVYIGPTMKYTS